MSGGWMARMLRASREPGMSEREVQARLRPSRTLLIGACGPVYKNGPAAIRAPRASSHKETPHG